MEDGAGFTDSKPWLRVGNSDIVNVAAEKEDKTLLLWLYKNLIALRSKEPSLYAGDYVPVSTESGILMYKREKKGCSSFLIAINCTSHATSAQLPHNAEAWCQILKTEEGKQAYIVENNLYLDADCGIIYAV